MKVGLLCGTSLSTFNINVLKPILNDSHFEVIVALIDNRPKPSFKRRFIKNLKRGRGGYMFIMAIKHFFGTKETSYSTIDFCQGNSIESIITDLPYSEKIVDSLKKYQVDVLLMIGGFGIIKEPLLSLAPNGILSYHHGDMRKYRGQPVAFWELYNNEKEMGVTVQRLSSGIDKGIPIVEKKVLIHKTDNVKSLRDRAINGSVGMMHDALSKILQSTNSPVSISYGKIYTIPNLRQFFMLQIKLFLRK